MQAEIGALTKREKQEADAKKLEQREKYLAMPESRSNAFPAQEVRATGRPRRFARICCMPRGVLGVRCAVSRTAECEDVLTDRGGGITCIPAAAPAKALQD